ncbi:protein translocase subunit SecDF [Mycoplasmopsis opalescens]|uniref:protein translocase subunit SecDF n=1 Tax=Mycoplasmopsis opalescens TaxID=114886 RepID=UPI0004A6B659|nr:MMPL family transporter [Mycoplasmopsis opalescens]
MRWFLTIFIVLSSVVVITTTTSLYTVKNSKKSIDHGGGNKFLLEARNDDGKLVSDQEAAEIAQSINDRIGLNNNLGGSSYKIEGDGKLTIVQSGELDDLARNRFIESITSKPTLIVTDLNGQPLFKNGKFIEPLSAKPSENASNEEKNRWIDWSSMDQSEYLAYSAPFKEAKSVFNQFAQKNESKYSIQIDLNKDASLEWAKLTDFIARRGRTNNEVFFWANLDKLVEEATSLFNKEWNNAKQNPVDFVYIGEKRLIEGQVALLKNKSIKSKNFLLSSTPILYPSGGQESFKIRGDFSSNDAKRVSANINYAVKNYNINNLSQSKITKQEANAAYIASIVALVAVLSLVSILLMVNYGLLGSLTTISMALYMFLTLTLFTVLRGEYSPLTFISLMIGLGIIADTNIVTFARLKRELYSGDKSKKAIKTSLRSSLSAVYDSNILILVASFIIFYFASGDVKTFGINLVFSNLLLIFSVSLFVFITTNIMLTTGFFDNRLKWLGIRPKKIQRVDEQLRKIKEYNYEGKAKYFTIISLIIIVAAMLIYAITAGIGKNFLEGFNRDDSYRDITHIIISTSNIQGQTVIDLNKANAIKQHLIDNADQYGILNAKDVINIILYNETNQTYIVQISTKQLLSSEQILAIKQGLPNASEYTFTNYQTSFYEAISIIKQLSIAISIFLPILFVYALIRFSWTSALALFFSLLHDLLITVALVVITRIPLNNSVIVAFSAVFIISMYDKVVYASKIKENLNTKHSKVLLKDEVVRSIVNETITSTIKRTILAYIIFISIPLIMLASYNSIDYKFALVLLLGTFVNIYSSTFIYTWLWKRFEIHRQRGMIHRYKNKYWVMPGLEEQYFDGINSYTP